MDENVNIDTTREVVEMYNQIYRTVEKRIRMESLGLVEALVAAGVIAEDQRTVAQTALREHWRGIGWEIEEEPPAGSDNARSGTRA